MMARDFVYWLQGFFELTEGANSLSHAQVKMIRVHLNLVFAHEIDPSIDGGKPEMQAHLAAIHAGKPPHLYSQNSPHGEVVRC